MKKYSDHDFEQLLNWVEGQLPAEEAKQLQAQLETAASDTLELIEWVRSFQRLQQKYVLVSPPDDLEEKLHNIFTKQTESKPQSHLFRRLLATLTFDSYQHFTAAGIRATSVPRLERQFVYSTDLAEITVDLLWDAQEKSIHLNGQIFPVDGADETIYLIELQRKSTTLKITSTDKLGKFGFTSLVPGIYDIILSSEQNEIAMTGVELQF